MLGVPVQDHPVMETANGLASGRLEQTGDEAVNDAGQCRPQHLEAKTKSDAQMFKIAFADALWMLDEQFFEHGYFPPVTGKGSHRFSGKFSLSY